MDIEIKSLIESGTVKFTEEDIWFIINQYATTDAETFEDGIDAVVNLLNECGRANNIPFVASVNWDPQPTARKPREQPGNRQQQPRRPRSSGG